MSFIGCVGSVMINSGLEKVVKSGSVEKMLNGKNSHKILPLTIVLEELLLRYKQIINQPKPNISATSISSKLWVDCSINPDLYMKLHISVERECDWPFHLYTVSKILPYFFIVDNHNYARHATYYLNNMNKQLPFVIPKMFLHDEHTTRHEKRYWNGICSNIFIETWFMTFDKSPGGLTDITLIGTSLKKWVHGLYICTDLRHSLTKLCTKHN